jgi:hypothetical protein
VCIQVHVQAFQAQICIQVQGSGISGPGMHSPRFRHFRPRYAYKFNLLAFQARVCMHSPRFRHFRPRYHTSPIFSMSSPSMHQGQWSNISGPGIGQTRPLFKIFRPSNMHKRHIFMHFRPMYMEVLCSSIAGTCVETLEACEKHTMPIGRHLRHRLKIPGQ